MSRSATPIGAKPRLLTFTYSLQTNIGNDGILYKAWRASLHVIDF